MSSITEIIDEFTRGSVRAKRYAAQRLVELYLSETGKHETWITAREILDYFRIQNLGLSRTITRILSRSLYGGKFKPRNSRYSVTERRRDDHLVVQFKVRLLDATA